MKAEKMCSLCGKRRATMRIKGGKTKSSKDHDLCRQCWQSLYDSFTAKEQNGKH